MTLLSCPTPGRSPLLEDFRRHFASRTRAVAVVPYDPALEAGSSIEYPQLQPETRRRLAAGGVDHAGALRPLTAPMIMASLKSFRRFSRRPDHGGVKAG